MVAMLDPVQLSRLKWGSRRGMLENDLVLTAFFERHGAELDSGSACALGSLLELADGDLWDLIAGRAELGDSASPAAREVLVKLRRC